MKSINASNIKFGNNQITNLYVGSQKIWDQNKPNKTLELMPIVMDSDANIRLSWVNSLATQGNSTFIYKPLNDINLSEINISYGYTINSNVLPRVIFNTFDNFCLLANRFGNYNTWSGGSSTGLFDEDVNITFNNQNKTISYYGHGDENNHTFIGGLYVNKTIKIPSKGSEGFINIRFFPYTFDDEFFAMTSFDLWFVDYNDTSNNRMNKYLWNNDNKTFTHISNGNVIHLEDTMFSSFNVSYEGLEGRIDYTVKQNNTTEFRDMALCTNDAMVHFIQEPHNDHRIYIVNWHTRAFNFAADQYSYLDTGDINENMFQLAGSKIINRSIQFIFPRWSDVLIPETIECEYDIIPEGTYKLNANIYEWDNMNFKHYTFQSNNSKLYLKKR